jgi:hypothetical protein
MLNSLQGDNSSERPIVEVHRIADPEIQTWLGISGHGVFDCYRASVHSGDGCRRYRVLYQARAIQFESLQPGRFIFEELVGNEPLQAGSVDSRQPSLSTFQQLASYNGASFCQASHRLSSIDMTIPEGRIILPSTSEAILGAKIAKTASMAAYLLVASLMLSWVALFNRAPLVFADTISYSTAAFQREIPGLFSIFYSIFILPLHQGVTFWPVVFVQSAIIAHLLYLTARTVTLGTVRKLHMLLIVGALAVFSSLPWVSGEILPDVFTPVVLLGLFLLAFADQALSRAELIYVGALTTLAIAAHLSHVPIAAGLILLCIALRVVFLRRSPHTLWWAARLALPLVLAVASMFAVNLVSSHQLVLARNSNVFLLAKWIDEGPALSYLEGACPGARYALCAYLEDLKGKSHDELKWGGNSPFKKVGTFDELEPEAREIVRGTLYSHPSEILRHAFTNAARQLIRFQAGDGLTQEFARWVGEHVGKIYGAEIGRPFIASRQAQGKLPITPFRYLHLLGLAVSTALCLWVLLMRRDILTQQLTLLYTVVFGGIVWSAIVTGALSAPYDRYMARIIWLVCFVGLVGAFPLARRQPILRARVVMT